MITDYLILERNNAGQLALRVSEFIQKGWQPIGGVSIGAEAAIPKGRGEVLHYLQAIVKYQSD